VEEKHARGHEIEPSCFPRGEAATPRNRDQSRTKNGIVDRNATANVEPHLALGLGPLPDVVFPALVNRLAEEPAGVLDMNSGTLFGERGDVSGRQGSRTRRQRVDGLSDRRLQDAPDLAACGNGLRIDLAEGQALSQLV